MYRNNQYKGMRNSIQQKQRCRHQRWLKPLLFIIATFIQLMSVRGYEIISENTIFSRWRSVISRVVKMPKGNIVDFDVSLASTDC